MNTLADFCVYSSPETGANGTIADDEARVVSYCSLAGHGTRVMPPGTITGAQWLFAKDYIQLVGFVDQTKLGLTEDDSGGGMLCVLCVYMAISR